MIIWENIKVKWTLSTLRMNCSCEISSHASLQLTFPLVISSSVEVIY